MTKLMTREDLAGALQSLVIKEPRFGALLEAYGQPSLRRVPATLESLLIIITEQFLSLAAGAAIWTRIRANLGEVSATSILACPQEELVKLGLSRAKAKSFHAAAEAWLAGKINLEADLEELRRQLLNLWGVGPWTVDVFLLGALGHGDAWPVGDVALQHAVHDFLGLQTRPTARQMETFGEPWRPYRAAASRLLWAHYRALKGKPQAPSQE